ncbi:MULTISPECIES: matrixin family metalloprotease [unclassified Bradyrhizobium]|uniref:matrixin family metalloprotease n=1 Tax=unclassified Bradyrhizobium TaxID=2631580 RepID=UPI0028EB211F|nr:MULTISPECIES: matrixin family metalloprotease [unclassified Bradyrhizobium]
MIKITALTMVAFAAVIAPVHADDNPGIPPGARWRADSTAFFFRVAGTEEGLYRDAFARAEFLWQPGNFSFQMTYDATGNAQCKPRPPNIRIVNIAQFDSKACGANFDPTTLAITNTWTDDQNALVAGDITFNTSFRWGLYGGPLRPGVYDFQRVAAHELGHAGGLNHSPDRNSIMYRLVGDVEQPNPNDQNNLRAQYATAAPPLPPGSYACPPSLPWSEVVPLGELSGTRYVLGQCLDKDRPRTVYSFSLSKPAKMAITIGADVNEMNVLLQYGLAQYPWRDENTGNKAKTSPVLNLATGDYKLNVYPAKAGSTFTIEFNFR